MKKRTYNSKNENMIKTAIATGVLNTLIALLAGFMIFQVKLQVVKNSAYSLQDEEFRSEKIEQ